MCGRYTLASDSATLTETFPGFIIPDDLPRRYNIAPSQNVAVIANTGKQEVDSPACIVPV